MPEKDAEKPKTANRPALCRIELSVAPNHEEAWVRDVLARVFKKNESDIAIALSQLRQRGSVDCGSFPRDLAETKVDQARSEVRRKNWPVAFRIEANR